MRCFPRRRTRSVRRPTFAHSHGASDLGALLFVTGDSIGRYVPASQPNLASDTHANEHVGVDIAYANNRTAATYTDKVTTYKVGPTGDIGDVQESATGGVSTPAGVAYDANFVYWADTASNSVSKSSFSNGGAGGALVTGLHGPSSVALGGPTIYIAQSTSITSADTATGAVVTTVVDHRSAPFSLLYASSPVPLLVWLEANGDLETLPLGGSPALLLGIGSALSADQQKHQHLIAVTSNYAFWGNPADGMIQARIAPVVRQAPCGPVAS